VIRDHQSRNGTMLDHNAISRSPELRVGAVVRLRPVGVHPRSRRAARAAGDSSSWSRATIGACRTTIRAGALKIFAADRLLGNQSSARPAPARIWSSALIHETGAARTSQNPYRGSLRRVPARADFAPSCSATSAAASPGRAGGARRHSSRPERHRFPRRDRRAAARDAADMRARSEPSVPARRRRNRAAIDIADRGDQTGLTIIGTASRRSGVDSINRVAPWSSAAADARAHG